MPGTTVVPAPSQTIENIGASGAWWVNDVGSFSQTRKDEVAELLFGSSGLELSAYRYNIGGGGVGVSAGDRAPETFLVSPGTYDWSRDAGGREFLQYADDKGVQDLIGFVNSAPAVWTTSGESCGGRLEPGREDEFAAYLADVVTHLDGEGERLDHVSPMNEPSADFAACIQEGMQVPVAQRDDIVRAVGAELDSRAPYAEVIADESTAVSIFNDEVPQWLAQPDTVRYVSRLAHHTYDTPSDTTRIGVRDVGRRFDRPTWSTEICCDAGSGFAQQYDPTITGGLVLASTIHRDFAYAGDSAFHWWTALSEEIGCAPVTDPGCERRTNTSGWNDGLLYYDESFASNGNQAVYRTKRYYVLGQYSKFVRPGAVRHEVIGAPAGLEISAYDRAGQWTIIVNNQGASDAQLDIGLTARSAVTASRAVRTSATEDWAAVALPAVTGGRIGATVPARSVTTYVLDQQGTGSTALTGSLVSRSAAKCVDAEDQSSADGTGIVIYDCNSGANQQITYTAAAELRVLDKCLDAAGRGTVDGTPVILYTCNGGANQEWRLLPDGRVLGEASTKCLDVPGFATANRTQLALYSCGTGTNQEFDLT